MNNTEDNLKVMRLALTLARRAIGKTSPNPVVGAVVVSSGGEVIGRGFHRRAGEAHAEVEAIDDALTLAGVKALHGALLFVTLEPCNHFGRTPPCTEKIIESGIRRVAVGAPDPNPLVSGKGVSKLRKAGIEVIEGVLAQECTRLNESYNKFITTGLPFVTLKIAASLDGRIAISSGESQWITGPESRRLVHSMRARADAVMVGSGTALADDPQLTVRDVTGPEPLRVIIDSYLKVSPSARIFSKGERPPVIFGAKGVSKGKVDRLRDLGAEVILVARTKDGLSLKGTLRKLAAIGVTSLLVEGGTRLSAGFIKAGLVDKLSLFYAPVLIGGDGFPMTGGLKISSLKKAPRLKDMKVSRVGADILVEGYLDR